MRAPPPHLPGRRGPGGTAAPPLPRAPYGRPALAHQPRHPPPPRRGPGPPLRRRRQRRRLVPPQLPGRQAVDVRR
ncbi:hypothetical protein F3K40_15385 [Streptomyces sp. LBUM 1478]|nr:hypothetical protein [Streptomyces sp. LBUM 1478]MBP5930433.1 hypothetical protein [Streptomyces sp. LBUM 1479]